MRPLFSRIPESLPSLHDEVLAAAANAAISMSADQKRKQVSSIAVVSLVLCFFLCSV